MSQQPQQLQVWDGKEGLEKAGVLGKGTSEEEGSVPLPSQGFPSTDCPKPACAQPLRWGLSRTEKPSPGT